jgi:hypothetical protein
VRLFLAIALTSVLLAGCGESPEATEDAGASRSMEPATRIERCVERLLRNASPRDFADERVRVYARTTYCEPFDAKGWVYDDGALSIATHTWATRSSGVCMTARPGGPARTVPCETLERPSPRRLECALLRHVRRSEVETYLERLQRTEAVQCDDGTPLDELGVP